MKAFVATSLKNVEEAVRITRMLEEHSVDHQCCITEIGSLRGLDLFEHNVQGIRDSDIFISIIKNLGKDTSVEIGIAYALGKRRIAVAYEVDPRDTMVYHASGKKVKEEDLPNVIEQLKAEIDGGDHLEFYVPHLTQYAAPVFRDLVQSFESQILVDGKNVGRLEAMLSERFGRHVVATSSGTSALILALQEFISTDRKEVLVPSLTFPATIQAIFYAGGVPIYVDIDQQTWNMDSNDAERKISRRTAAIMPVNLFGVPCDIGSFQELSRNQKIPLVYDSCQSFGARTPYGEVGCFGDAEVLSLDVTKVLSGGQGGYITTPSKDLAERIRKSKNFGCDERKVAVQRGLNARMLEFSAILAIHCLNDVSKIIEKRVSRIEAYKRHLSKVNGIRFQDVPEGYAPAYQFFGVMLDHASDDLAYRAKAVLHENGIGTRIYSPELLHKNITLGGGEQTSLPVTERIAPKILCLPIHDRVKEQHMQTVAETLNEVMR